MLTVYKFPGGLNLLEPKGPVQVCRGIALPLPPPQVPQSIVGLGFHYSPFPFLLVSGHSVTVFYSNYLQMFISLINPSFLWSSSFPLFVLFLQSLFVLSSFLIQLYRMPMPSLSVKFYEFYNVCLLCVLHELALHFE